MKILVTGAAGFVGKHLCRYLARKGDIVIAVTRDNDYTFYEQNIINYTCDLENLDDIVNMFKLFRPDGIIHLAAKSSVAYSWEHPSLSFLNNAQIFLNVIEAQRLCLPSARFLSVGSSEQYGILSPEQLPVLESAICSPASPYAVARVAQEQLALIYAKKFNIDVICTRSFNHIGPGQSPQFVIPSFLYQAFQIKKRIKNSFECGDISIIRDFVDIRDIVRAYRFLLLNGKKQEIYNISTGIGTSLKKVLDIIMQKFNIQAEIKILPHLLRPADNKIIIGDNNKIIDLGFKFQYDLETSLENIIEKDFHENFNHNPYKK